MRLACVMMLNDATPSRAAPKRTACELMNVCTMRAFPNSSGVGIDADASSEDKHRASAHAEGPESSLGFGLRVAGSGLRAGGREQRVNCTPSTLYSLLGNNILDTPRRSP